MNLYRQLKLLGCSERNFFSSLYFKRLTSHGVATHAGRSIKYLQHTETGDFHPLASPKMLCDQADEVVEHLLPGALADVMLVSERCYETFLGDPLASLWHGRGIRSDFCYRCNGGVSLSARCARI